MYGKLKDASVETLRRAASVCDGWTIFDADEGVFAELPREFIQPLIHVHKSDLEDPKQTITGDDGEIKMEVRGIYGLSFLYALATELGVDTETRAWGRGFRASALQERLNVKFKEMENEEKSTV